MDGVLAIWYDPKLATPVGGAGVARLIPVSEGIRLFELAGIAAWASLIPRRLGADATAQELAADKRMCRRIAHAADQLAKLWTTVDVYNAHPKTIDKKRAGAVVLWDTWWAQHLQYLNNRRTFIATFAIRSRFTREGNIYVTRLDKEEEALKDIIVP